MFNRISITFLLLALVLLALGCPKGVEKKVEPQEIPLRSVPAQRLNYRFEGDVPAPGDEGKKPIQNQERNEAVQLEFDEKRPMEILDRTITSPNDQRVLAVYRKIEDLVSEFRIDVFSTDGKLIRKVTHEEMAVHFPDTILWSPDSNNFAFVAMVRGQEKDIEKSESDKKETPTPTPELEIVSTDDNSNTESGSETNTETDSTDTPELAKEVITFRTEQIYISDVEGIDIKPLTQNEGLIYFYFVWSPDSLALASLATTITEWRIREARLKNAGQIFIPQGRPRMVEKNGRERLLDDYPTTVHPVWSPDSAKLAVAFNKQVRVYDTIGERPTQAAIPLNNDLLLASKTYEEQQKAEGNELLAPANSNQNTNAETKKEGEEDENSNTAEQSTSTLPDAKSLVTFNPIINLEWNQETLLYIQTGWVMNFIDTAENTSSYLRWHRLVLSPQAIKIENTPLS